MSVGPNTKVMRKAKMSFQSGQVKQLIRTYAVEIQTGDKRELAEDIVTMKLRKAMGANCKYRQLCMCSEMVIDVMQTIDNPQHIRSIDFAFAIVTLSKTGFYLDPVIATH